MSEKLPQIESKVSPEEPVVKEVLLKEVVELEEPIKKIIEKIQPRIEAGEYGLIIGDDASGRVPAIIIGNFIRKVAEFKGAPKPNIIFVPGKLKSPMIPWLDLRLKKFKKHLSEYDADQGKRMLIVTDTIEAGGSLRELVGLIKEAGYVCDIATIGIEKSEEEDYERQRNENLKDAEIISGEFSSNRGFFPNTPSVYQHPALSGVKKVVGDLKSKTYKSLVPKEGRGRIQEWVNKTRKDAKFLTDKLFDEYQSEYHE